MGRGPRYWIGFWLLAGILSVASFAWACTELVGATVITGASGAIAGVDTVTAEADVTKARTTTCPSSGCYWLAYVPPESNVANPHPCHDGGIKLVEATLTGASAPFHLRATATIRDTADGGSATQQASRSGVAQFCFWDDPAFRATVGVPYVVVDPD